MKTNFAISLFGAVAVASANANGLYYIPNDMESSIPVVWSVGMDTIWDNNTNPGGITDGDETFSLNPYIGVSFVNTSPQTTLDVYARLGMIYYLDEPAADGSDDLYKQARIGVNLTHRFDERLRLISNNFLSYELEPDYSYGVASSRQLGGYLFWETDTSIGYRWTERFATYSGFQLSGLVYDDNVPNTDRFTLTLYNQFRYQLSPQSVLTASYRYSETDGDGFASDSANQYLLVGLEHRFSPNTILIMNTGAQLRVMQGNGGGDSANPYLELTVKSRVNTQFTVSGFVRYGADDYDTVIEVPLTGLAEFEERLTLRVGVTGGYQLSPSLSLFGGVNLISTMYQGGRDEDPAVNVADADDTLLNLYVGASLKFTDNLYGTLTYNFTDSNSDALNRTYDRSRVSVGLRAEF